MASVQPLVGAGAKVRVSDPQGKHEGEALLAGVKWIDNPYQAANDADLVVLLTEWNEFRGLDLAKLEKPRKLAGGIVQARCPACAEGGHDRTGEHLRIYPDGRFGCCVQPKDSDHRKRIWALAGLRKAGNFTLRIKTPPALPAASV